MGENNPEEYYEPESYLLDEVGPAFRATGKLDCADFYTILIWKAEREKTRHKDRLKRNSLGTFEDAVMRILKNPGG